MADLDLVRVDVFTEELYAGNPANVVLGADALDEVQMEQIALEAGSPVTAFTLRSRKADLRLRFFSQHAEEPLSGHGAIGAMWCLALNRAFGAATWGRHRLETAVGVLPMSIEGGPEGPKRVWMTQQRPMFSDEGDVKDVASALGTGVDSLFDAEFPIGKSSTGIPFLLVPVRSIDVIEKLKPKREELAELAKELDIAGVEVYSWGVLEEGSTVHSRCFQPSLFPLEEPASAMAAGALAAYLAQHDFIGKDRFEKIVVEQGHWMGRPSRIFVRIEKKGSQIRKIEVGGSAKVSFRTRMTVPE